VKPVPYDGRTYRILIASPSDVEEERELAVRVIQEWNDLYSFTRKVVLLPVRWETHTAPEYGTRPQEVINRAIVDSCDLLLGVFWTRIGTPTGRAESGTLEEITRVANAGKPVMLYFSKVGTDPDKLDLEQLRDLKKFKEQTYPNALTESYKSLIEFRDKFAKQIELKVRDLQKSDASGQPPPLTLLFTDGADLAGNIQRTIELPEVKDLDSALSHETPETREKVLKAVEQSVQTSIGMHLELAIRNTGSSGIRNLFVRMAIRASSESVEVADASLAIAPLYASLLNPSIYSPLLNPVTNPLLYTNYMAPYLSTVALNLSARAAADRSSQQEFDDSEGLTRSKEGWNLAFEWDALQPQRIRRVKPQILVRAKKDSRVEFSAKIFADSFAEPVILSSILEITVKPKPVALAELVQNLDALRKDEGTRAAAPGAVVKAKK
jgi:hypothetical protein